MLAALIAVAWVVVQVVGRLGGNETEPSPAAAPTTATTATPVATTAPPADQVDVALKTSATACESDNLRIVPSVPSGQFSGGPVNVDLMIATLDGSACTFRPTEDDLLVVIEAKRAPVWDSSVCRGAFFDTPVAVPADWSTVTQVAWSGRGSGTGCGSGEGFAPPGTYTLKIASNGGEPGEVTFSIGRKPAAPTTATAVPPTATTPTATTKPTPSASPGTEPTAR